MGFPKIFVLSLSRSADRRAAISDQFSSCKFEFFDAVDGYALTDTDINKYFDTIHISRFESYMTPGAFGCALSHAFIYKRIVNSGLPGAFIFEDDVIVDQDTLDRLPQIEQYCLDSDIDVLMLFFLNLKVTNLTGPRGSSYPSSIIYSPSSIDDIPLSTVAYYISRSASDKLTSGLFPIKRGADAWKDFFKLKLIDNIYVAYPCIVGHSDRKGEIDYAATSRLGHAISRFARFCDRHNIPILNPIFRSRRRRRMEHMSQVNIVAPSVTREV
ncbi:Glycosyltransferase family 25 (LPS biosynthesis protein) [Devosia enhydra]|uniref:Glycosyltransferase family 25 (LPS biosynthesis protein) n=1 Tax=Devosia enhydra TaxID=665118 RepID=A0A1K2I0Z5_9HYPH|nr:glycosyltransferase family 25 protein [Devosia enhydra]SFZ85943.1 Glycosyltransferase family 25 (LPS biosynthesis protein) [Devosia enhydra]